jgi:ubiquinone/menaquinone biosynthesis C-methylase UbiE
MPASRGPRKDERPSTYFVADREKKEELIRLTIQGRMLTKAMGDILLEQGNPSTFQNVLDVACGPGDWAIDMAQAYPTISVVGIDISQLMIDYASEEAEASQLADRVSFQVMDVLGSLDFPNESFDLVNLRLGVSFLRTWDWPKLLHELLRITRPGGVLRLTDTVGPPESSSAAVTQLFELGTSAFFRAGHLFALEKGGLTGHLADLLKYHGWQQVQTKKYDLEFRAGTQAGKAAYEDLVHFQTARPFFQKWGISGKEFDQVYTQVLKDGKQSNFWLTFQFLSVWGTKL